MTCAIAGEMVASIFAVGLIFALPTRCDGAPCPGVVKVYLQILITDGQSTMNVINAHVKFVSLLKAMRCWLARVHCSETLNMLL